MSLITKTEEKKKYSTFPKMVLLGEKEIQSLIYHDVFDYPLTPIELIKWTAGESFKLKSAKEIEITTKNGFLFLNKKEGATLKRIMRKRISERKLIQAKKAARILSVLPTIKMIGISGALAMHNASEGSDIDFLIITKKGNLWTSRLLTMALLALMRIPRRKYGDRDQKDKLCLNMWLDEDDLTWKKKERNVFTAHEISQIVPLINKDKTYERFLSKNNWITDFWPNATNTKTEKGKKIKKGMNPIELLARKFQYWYMRDKITREVVTPTRAFFHPVDWESIIFPKLKSY